MRAGGERLAQAGDRRHRERGARVGEVAQGGQLAVAEAAQAEQHAEQRRHAGQAGDALALEQADDAAGEREALLEHERPADEHGQQQLVEAVVERERQAEEHDLVVLHLEVLRQRGRGEGHVLVRERDALRLAGRAGRVDQRREVDRGRAQRARAPRARRAGRTGRRRPRPRRRRRRCGGSAPVRRPLRHDAAVRALADDPGGAGIGQHLAELLGLHRRVERREGRAGAQHAVDRGSALDRVREEDAHAVAALDARGDQAAGDAVGQAIELAVADAPIARDDRGLGGRARGGRAQMVVERADRHG